MVNNYIQHANFLQDLEANIFRICLKNSENKFLLFDYHCELMMRLKVNNIPIKNFEKKVAQLKPVSLLGLSLKLYFLMSISIANKIGSNSIIDFTKEFQATTLKFIKL